MASRNVPDTFGCVVLTLYAYSTNETGSSLWTISGNSPFVKYARHHSSLMALELGACAIDLVVGRCGVEPPRPPRGAVPPRPPRAPRSNLLWGVGRSKLQLYGCITTVLFERRTRKLRAFVRLETIQANTGRNHKTLVEQLERIDSLFVSLMKKISFHFVCW